ncbi:MAG TPA: DUF5985 family protein [Terriglobales bacterium]|jgi:uncharacterized membrane protein HdeD (DUF308 family)|nr:DUF5985 family protein [Terriglobales bacterium]
MKIEAFLLGVVATSSITAGVFFLKFWKRTHDLLFLAFAVAFVIEGLNRVVTILTPHPNEASPWTYLVRLFAFLLILSGILHKNYGTR